ncbi:primosomal replication protein N [Hydromonas duriensis]|uniref:Replication restart protein PriB n=1 Tax=Hydromonas duriensis TaxID=1527608 RepID=A0A4R6Y9L0_9BURK|nr:primosomal replication protein N [Hydromonas duriensis]TDR32132.1 restart primosome assembly protein PriB [Hydromonas duriensis]
MSTDAVHPTNRLILDVCLLEKSELRKTLAGVPVVEAVFAHTGVQSEIGLERQAQFELAGIAMGEMASVLERAQVGLSYRVQGFLNRKSLKSLKLRLHLTHMSPIAVDVLNALTD